MREILFKAKKWDSKEWVEGSLITLDVDSGYCFISEPHTGASTLPVRNLIYNHTHLIDAKTICQFTGLIDKNGNKIWDNDILEWKFNNALSEYYLCTWLEDECCFSFESNGCYKNPVDCYDEDYMNEFCMEVIGNVFDNADLIN